MKLIHSVRVIPSRVDESSTYSKIDVDVQVKPVVPKFIAKFIGSWAALTEMERRFPSLHRKYKLAETTMSKSVVRNHMVRCTFMYQGEKP